MKVTVTPEGVVTLEVSNGDGQIALDLIRSLQAEAKAKPQATPAPKPKVRKVSRRVMDHRGQLQPTLFDALTWLARNDSEQGLRASDLAQYAAISNGAAGQRLIKLASAGLAYRVKDGHYRAVKPPQDEKSSPTSEYSQAYGTGHGEA